MTYYLVQRLTTNTEPFGSSTGFDRLFSLEYMGSSEFEWGAIPKALKAIRSNPVVVSAQTVEIDGTSREVYFVGHKGGGASAAQAMTEWAKGNERRPAFYGKEYTNFPEMFSGKPNRWSTTDAWWAIEEGVAWALDPAVADRLVEAFNSAPKEKK